MRRSGVALEPVSIAWNNPRRQRCAAAHRDRDAGHSGRARHRGFAGGLATLAVDRRDERLVSQVAGRQHRALHRTRRSAGQQRVGSARGSRGSLVGRHARRRVLPLQCRRLPPGADRRPPVLAHRRPGLRLGVSDSSRRPTVDSGSRPPWACRSSFRTAAERGGRFRTYDKRNGLTRLIRTLAEDRGGNLWIGLADGWRREVGTGRLRRRTASRKASRLSQPFSRTSPAIVCFRGRVPGRRDGWVGPSGARRARSGSGRRRRAPGVLRRPALRLVQALHRDGSRMGGGPGHEPRHGADRQRGMVGRYRGGTVSLPGGTAPRVTQIDPSIGRVHAGRRAGDTAGLPALRGLAGQRLGVHHLFDDDGPLDDDGPRPLGRSRWARDRPGWFTRTHCRFRTGSRARLAKIAPATCGLASAAGSPAMRRGASRSSPAVTACRRAS